MSLTALSSSELIAEPLFRPPNNHSLELTKINLSSVASIPVVGWILSFFIGALAVKNMIANKPEPQPANVIEVISKPQESTDTSQSSEPRPLLQTQDIRTEQQRFAQQTFEKQQALLYCYTPLWEQDNPDRATAFYQTQEHQGQIFKQRHTPNDVAMHCLQNNNIDIRKYGDFFGNHLQQQLCCEATQGLNAIVTLHQLSLAQDLGKSLQQQTLRTFDDAFLVSQMGDCAGSSHLIDLANISLLYLRSIVTCAAQGCIDGTIGIVVGMAQMVCHPVQTIQNVTKVVGDVFYDYVPQIALPLSVLSDTPLETFLQEHARIEQNWKILESEIKDWWYKTPGYEKVGSIVQASCNFASGYLVTMGITKLAASKLRVVNTQAALAGEGLTAGRVNQAAIADEAIVTRTSNIVKSEMLAQQARRVEMLGALSEEVIRDLKTTIVEREFVRKEVHIFKSKHNLKPLIVSAGGADKLLDKIIRQLPGRVPAEGVFLEVRIFVEYEEILVSGRCIKSIPKIATCYVPDEIIIQRLINKMQDFYK